MEESFYELQFYLKKSLSYTGSNIAALGTFAIVGGLFLYTDVTGKPSWMLKYKVQPGVNQPVCIEINFFLQPEQNQPVFRYDYKNILNINFLDTILISLETLATQCMLYHLSTNIS